jgi:hypothetical protein
MKWSDQQELFQSMINLEKDLLDRKGLEYSSDTDSLANFKAKLDIGVSPMQVAWIFLEKHLSSIKSYIKLGHELSDESIEGRINDARNYLFLIACLVKEQKNKSSDGAQ